MKLGMTSLGPVELDRAAGVLVGLAAGDALGAGYEFGSVPSGDVEMIGGGLGHFEPGEWTDDTSMAMAVAEPAATGSLAVLAVGQRFLDWFQSHPPDIGIQTRATLEQTTSAAELESIAATHFHQHPTSSAGNGSLMRTAPVALAHLGDDAAIAASARAVSLLTHADSLATDACVLWCIAVDRAVREGRFDGAWNGLELLEPEARQAWTGHLDAARSQPAASFTPNGFVVTALQAALASVLQTPVPNDMPCLHLQHALQTAVHIGNDTDTVAAIAGSLLGARWGGSAVPFGWQRMLHGWPGYRVRDLVRLATLAARGGAPDSSGWPSVARMQHWYQQHHPAPAICVPLKTDSGVFVGTVGGAATADADAVVSLCRMGTDDVKRERHDVWLIDSPRPVDNPNLEFVLADAADAIARLRAEAKTVFIHCVRAEARTPAVAATYLVLQHHLDPDAAWAEVGAVLPETRRVEAYDKAIMRLR